MGSSEWVSKMTKKPIAPSVTEAKPRPAHVRQSASLEDVSRFVIDCHNARFPDSRAPWKPLPTHSK